MITHTVIESMSAYELTRAQDPQGERVWWTTSPYLLAHLPKRGELVRSPEENLAQVQSDALGRAARKLGEEFAEWYQGQCTWGEYANFRFVLAPTMTRCFFVTAYKATLLARVVNEAGGEPVVCVGNPAEPAMSGLSMTYGRVETLFAFLADEAPELSATVIRHEQDANASQAIDRLVHSRPMARLEKLLSILNNTPGSFCYKVWRNLQQRGLYPFRSLALSPFSRRTYWIFKDCELLEEAVSGIVLRGGRVAKLPPLPRMDSGRDFSSLPEADAASAHILLMVRELMANEGQAWHPALDVAARVTARRALRFLESLRQSLPELTAGFERTVGGSRLGDEILTNALTGPVEGLFYGFCRSRGIRVNALEHGVTLGLSAWSQFEGRQSGMLAADRGYYHCPRAVDAVREIAPWQEMHVVGLPRIMPHIVLRWLQRMIGRRLLGVGRGDHVVMYVPDLEHNNFIYGPQLDNDLQYQTKTREVTAALCRSFPNSRVVLKLYPTQRYIDAYDFSDMAEEFPNLRIIVGIDFRFLRTSADLIITSSTQSTLGWVSTSGVPFLLLEFEWCPTRVEGLRLSIPGIRGLSAAIIPDEGAVCMGHYASLAGALSR
jgi:hypothetical protein